MFTGRIPLAHGVHDNGQFVPAGNQMLAEILQANGYLTVGFVSTTVLARQFGLDQGFDLYDDSMAVDGQIQNERTADQTTRRAMDWLVRRDRDKPFFLFVHFYDAHSPYEPPEPFASQTQHPYAGEIAFVDANIGRLMAALKAEGVYDSSIIIVTADHGEMLGEHGEDDHGYFIYESAIKVPLILKRPGQQTARRVESIVGLVDLTPSICSIVGADVPMDMAGRDIADQADDTATGPRWLYTQSPYPQIVFDTNPLLGLVDDRWKFILTTNSELYDLSVDPGEQANLLATHPARARTIRDRLDAVVAGVVTRMSAEPAANDAQTRQMLASLGYVGSGQQQANLEIDLAKPDPKDFVDAYAEFHATKVLRDEGRMDEAIEKCSALAQAHPGARGLQWALTDLLVQTGRFAEALAPCELLEDLAPDDPNTHAMKGIVCGRLGRYAEARAALLRAVELDPTLIRAYRELGDTHIVLGEYPEAAQAYEAALALDDRNLYALNNLACLYVDYLGEPDKAVALAQRGMALKGDVPILMDTAGWALANVGRYEEAYDLIAASAAKYSVPETRYHLGWVLEKLGRQADARREYETARDLLGDDHADPIYAKATEGLERVTPP